MDRFEDMRCFVQVADQGSVTRAAEALGIAPSAVSRRLKDLELRLGVQLMARTTRRMSLTEAGQIFCERARRILADVDEAESEVSDTSRMLAGQLRIAAPLTFGVAHLTPIITEFVSMHPELAVDVDMSDRIVDLVGEGFDLAVRIGSLRDSTLVARKICDVRVAVAAAPSFLDKHGRPTRPEDMRDWPALAYVGSERPDIWRFRRPDGGEGSVQLPVRMRANNGTVLLSAAAAGLGVVIQPSFILCEAVRSGQLETVLTDHAWPEIAIFAVYPQTRHLSAKARTFIDFLRARIGSRPSWEAMIDA
ncbi:LysR family transcriptional regulator [Limibaculum sp. M0105]|uniref:LysR family transcriptional regulator n=1 Tax=Thermohalobaculum xanthum TaxID=2753746 RepID=A0A8J7M6X8_9RHOB|nr:LysR family transcriptional regulator [Thermohalobaculum xanthum]MBK0399325.1 LysR family transcriptional regulator [Thermohalobaculum xanthum]